MDSILKKRLRSKSIWFHTKRVSIIIKSKESVLILSEHFLCERHGLKNGKCTKFTNFEKKCESVKKDLSKFSTLKYSKKVEKIEFFNNYPHYPHESIQKRWII